MAAFINLGRKSTSRQKAGISTPCEQNKHFITQTLRGHCLVACSIMFLKVVILQTVTLKSTNLHKLTSHSDYTKNRKIVIFFFQVSQNFEMFKFFFFIVVMQSNNREFQWKHLVKVSEDIQKKLKFLLLSGEIVDNIFHVVTLEALKIRSVLLKILQFLT